MLVLLMDQIRQEQMELIHVTLDSDGFSKEVEIKVTFCENRLINKVGGHVKRMLASKKSSVKWY